VFLVVAHSVTPAVDNSLVWYKPGWLGGNTRAMLSIEPSILAYQLAHVLAPLGLSATYTSYSMRFFPWWLALSGLGACAALAVTAARRHPATRAPLLFFVIALVPTANVVPLYVPAADRYLYLPMVGLAMLLTFAVAACPAPGAFARAARMRRAGLVLLSLLLISFAALALQRQSVWHDEVSLWRNALRTAPDSPAALLNLADACAERGDQRAAMNLRQNAVAATQGASAPAWAALAVGFAQTAQPALADRAYARAVAVDSRYADVVRLERSMRWDEGQMRALREMAGRRAK
jgi:tetratricopeptide (TPR) repeat protein